MNLPPIDKDFKVPESQKCTYPQCKCPHDHPGGDWCAKRRVSDITAGLMDKYQPPSAIHKYQTSSDVRGTQPDPKPTSGPAVWSLVMRDMADRDVLGANRYGVRLQPGNGRDALKDAYEEALDLAAYLRQAIYEMDGK